jgi:hypothetical protein
VLVWFSLFLHFFIFCYALLALLFCFAAFACLPKAASNCMLASHASKEGVFCFAYLVFRLRLNIRLNMHLCLPCEATSEAGQAWRWQARLCEGIKSKQTNLRQGAMFSGKAKKHNQNRVLIY